MDFPKIAEDASAAIQFHIEAIDFELAAEEKIISWIQETIKAEEKELQTLNFIFCNDTYLHQINVEYLDHDTLTDVITFPYTEVPHLIEGDIYISIERIRENALKFNVPFDKELQRVIIHGVLHLCGYKDKEETEQKEMRIKENFYLEKINEVC